MSHPDSTSLTHDGLDHEELFPIREVSRLTGINPVTLRAWERRYGLIQPTRTESGHRLYSRADIDEVRSILGWIERGVAVSKVGRILAKSHSLKEQVAEPQATGAANDWAQCQAQIRQAVTAFDERRLEQAYGQIFASYPQVVVFQDILMPVWQELRVAHDGFGRVSEWLFLDGFLRARVAQRLQRARDQQEVSVVLAAIPGQCRELELLVAALMLGTSEIAVSVLALGQPVEELSLVCERMAPHALVLFSNHPPAADLPKRLARLAMTLDCALLFAGEASDLAQDTLIHSQIACLGSEGRLMRRRLQQYLAGHLDS
ncbi:MerR family transcriptional regulator [Pseudomonas fontis]|uniref:MerR family transcriptional regulator n=1 Tax=Pseudomonas fontis TaxID=2942633 RepID=A0ABT5NNR0_9PSED|nr:MerR family transcriptional regulator [Pseudomonas fontis]MDD0973019.1 MerR family transcriptional regulator [Pseudomonas fontis]MDD0989788.1 MerR family transcriptional regulator [Pseudomonas fontis]